MGCGPNVVPFIYVEAYVNNTGTSIQGVIVVCKDAYTLALE